MEAGWKRLNIPFCCHSCSNVAVHKHMGATKKDVARSTLACKEIQNKKTSETAREIRQHFGKLSTVHLQLYNI